MEVFDRETGDKVALNADGTWWVTDQRRYVVRTGESALPASPFLRPIGGVAGVSELSFDNYVGLAQVGRARFTVKNSKLTVDAFNSMNLPTYLSVYQKAYDTRPT